MVGIWHGARWNLLLWGLYYGLFLALESYYPHWCQKIPRWGQHLYLFGVVMVGWVIFHTDNLLETGLYLKALFGLGEGSGILYYLSLYLDPYNMLVLGLGIGACLPVFPWLRLSLSAIAQRIFKSRGYLVLKIGEFIYLGGIFWISVILYPNNLYNYFIYNHF